MSNSSDLRPKVTIPLNFPISVDGITYSELTMRRPKTKDSLAAAKHSNSDAERGVFLFARLCDVSPEAIEELDEIDAEALGAQLNAFRGRQSATPEG